MISSELEYIIGWVILWSVIVGIFWLMFIHSEKENKIQSFDSFLDKATFNTFGLDFLMFDVVHTGTRCIRVEQKGLIITYNENKTLTINGNSVDKVPPMLAYKIISILLRPRGKK